MNEADKSFIHEPKPIVRHFSFLIALFADSFLSLMSLQIILTYLRISPYNTSWDMALTGSQAAAIYLILVILGSILYWQVLIRVKNEFDSKGFIVKSPQQLMVLFGTPFIFVAGALAFTLDLIGLGLPFYPTASMLYGFGLGMTIVRILFGLKYMKKWRISAIPTGSGSRPKWVSNWKITNQLEVAYTKRD